MSGAHDRAEQNESDAPFGSRRDLPGFPLYVLGLLYVAWFVALVWMAVFESVN